MGLLDLLGHQLKPPSAMAKQMVGGRATLIIHMITEADLIRQVEQDKGKKFILLAIFLAAVVGFVVLLGFMPTFTSEEKFKLLRWPKSPEDLFNIVKVLENYSRDNKAYALFAFIYLYIFMQSFAIPGPVFLCILSGPLFGPVPAFFLNLICSVIGASCCFGLSYSLGRGLVFKYFSSMFVKFNNMVNSHKDSLFWYMLFLRLTPLIPNWFVNLGSPLVGMPYLYFAVGSLIGLIPNNLILIQTGMTLKEIDSIGFNPKHFVVLMVLGFLSLVPTFMKKKLQDIDSKSSKTKGFPGTPEPPRTQKVE